MAKPELEQLLVQTRLVALDRADRAVALAEVLLGADDRRSARCCPPISLVELVAGLDAAGPGIGVVVDADLVEFGRVDAVEPVGDVAELDRIGVPDRRQPRSRAAAGLDVARNPDRARNKTAAKARAAANEFLDGHKFSLSIALRSSFLASGSWTIPMVCAVRSATFARQPLLAGRSAPIVRRCRLTAAAAESPLKRRGREEDVCDERSR